MSTIHTHCPHCMLQIAATDSILGQYVDCPACGRRFRLQAENAFGGGDFSPPKRISMATALVFQSIALVFSIVKHAVIIYCVDKYMYRWDFWEKMAEKQELVALAGFGPLCFSIVFTCVLHYKCWRAIPSSFARTTPGKAVGGLFIPFYNLYWAFPSFGGLGKDCAAIASKNGLHNSSLAGLGMTYSILWVGALLMNNVPGLGLLLDVAAFVVWIVFYKNVVRLLNGISPPNPETSPAD